MTGTINTLATWKALAKEVWGDVQSATVTLSARYTQLAVAKPKDSTVKELYGALPKAWQDKCSEGSFVATFSLAVKVVKAFDKAQKEGNYAGQTAVSFVEKCGSLVKAEKVLFPAKAEGKAPANPKAGGEAQTAKAQSVSVTKETSVDKFGEVCRMVDELNESDLKALAMLVADKIAKFQAKATAKV